MPSGQQILSPEDTADKATLPRLRPAQRLETASLHAFTVRSGRRSAKIFAIFASSNVETTGPMSL
jgi:hypothetical protein